MTLILVMLKCVSLKIKGSALENGAVINHQRIFHLVELERVYSYNTRTSICHFIMYTISNCKAQRRHYVMVQQILRVFI